MTTREKKSTEGVRLEAPEVSGAEEILTPEALGFLGRLHRSFEQKRQGLLERRVEVQKRIDRGEAPDFLPSTREVREGSWQVNPPPADLEDRRTEITGPPDRKMALHALNSGARVFMADFEDALAPTFENAIQGQITVRDAVLRTLRWVGEDGRVLALQDKTATLVVRPRGLHLTERHLQVDDQPISGSLFDFGLYAFHNSRELIRRGTGPYFYLPKLESHLEARFWAEVFEQTERELDLPRGTIKATVLIETVLAAFEMEEILYELRHHITGLNAGRWDYLFSVIKKFRKWPDAVLPDRAQLTMTVPFMRAYTRLLVQTCHRRGAHAIGGMAAFVPSRKDPAVNETAFARVREDKERESGDGFDGTWVAHPDLVPVAQAVFDRVLGQRPHQKDRPPEKPLSSGRELIDFRVPDGRITEAGIRSNLSVALLYLESWLQGRGAVTIRNLMEDTATAEIARSQLWQWIHARGARLEDGREITASLVSGLLAEEKGLIAAQRVPGNPSFSSLEQAARILGELVQAESFVDFLTETAYPHLQEQKGEHR